jgi:hypothetical protein
MHTNEVIVRWGLTELSGLLEEVGMKRPFTVASDRWSHLNLPRARRWRQVPTDRIGEIADAALECEASLPSAAEAQSMSRRQFSSATGLRLVSVPTT